MKHTALLFLLLFQTAISLAAGTPTPNSPGLIDDPDVAKIQVQVESTDETFDRLRVSVLCYDRRTRPNSVQPEWKVVPLPSTYSDPANLAICLYRPRGNPYDPATKILTLHYSLFEPSSEDGAAMCTDHVVARIDMRRVCAPWQH